jgi:hypothetical protein
MAGAPEALALPLALDLVAREGGVWGRGTGQSMLPLIGPGSELQVVPLEGAPISRGMLVAYPQDGRLVIHRVIACEPGSGLIVTKGDALAAPDPPLPLGRVAGRVVALRAHGRPAADLTRFPWPAVSRFLAGAARLACRLRLDQRPASPARRLGWKLLRAPFYLARLLLP